MRFLLGRIIRGFLKAWIRRTVARIAARFIGRRVVSKGFQTRHGGEKKLEEALEKGADIMDILELVGEMASIIDDAREAAIAASAGVFESVYADCNEGQMTLIDSYCFEASEEYFGSTDDPDPEDYFAHMFSQHEAIGQALDQTVEQSWVAASEAATQVMYASMAEFIGEEALAGLIEFSGGKPAYTSKLSYRTHLAMNEMGNTDFIPGAVRRSTMWRPIEDMRFYFNPVHPQAPFYLKVEGISTHALISGQWTLRQAEAFREDLYRRTASDPSNPKMPRGFEPLYDVDVSGTKYADVLGTNGWTGKFSPGPRRLHPAGNTPVFYQD